MRCAHWRHVSMMLVCALGLSLASCHQSPPATAPTASDANQSVDHVPQNAPGTATQAATSRAAPTPAQSFATLMRALPATEQTGVRDWYQRMGGPSMDDATPAQVAWMQARYYPMPADIARAESMSETELKAAAGTGNTTAQILYVARLLDEFHAHLAAGQSFFEVPTRFIMGISATMPQILASGSPYAGYLFAAKDRLIDLGGVESKAATQLAGLVWASKFGDTRADRLLKTPTVQAVNSPMATMAMDRMLHEAVRGNPKLFSTPVSPIPPSSH